MVGHLPIKTKSYHVNKLEEYKKMVKDIKSEPFYKRRIAENGGTFYRLPSEYFMDEEHGLEDNEVVSYTPPSMGCIYEIHLNAKGEINMVYLVM